MATGDKVVTLDGLKAVYDSQDTDGIKQDISDLKSAINNLPYKERFNPDDVENGYINSSGSVVSNAGWRATDYMPLNPNGGAYYSGIVTVGSSSVQSAYYTSDHTFISAFKQGIGTQTLTDIPPTAAYIRMSVIAEDINSFSFKSEIMPGFEDIAINELNGIVVSAYKVTDVAVVLGTLNTASGAETTSTTYMRTDYLPSYVDIVSATNCKIRIYAYDKTGTFVGGRTGDGSWTKDYTKYKWFDSPFNIYKLPTEYIYRVVFGQVVGDVTEQNIQPKVTINTIKRGSKPTIYEVGDGKQFSTFTEMLITLKDDDTEKIVYVYSGTYDIFDEIGGAEYMESVDTSLTWRDVSNIVPPNTTIIGIGDVVLSWNPTDAEIIDQNHAFLFSPLNVSGSCKIQNIKIHCSNCRYGIHDETSGLAIYNGVVHEFENVEVIYTASTYGVHYAYGAGHNKNCKYKYKNCLFSAAYDTAWSIHDWPATANEGSTFEFDNCVFANNVSNTPAMIRFSSTDTVGRLDEVKINGCVFNGINFGSEWSSDVKQGYKVQTMLCKPYTVSYVSNILEADRIAPVDYLQIP